MIHQMPIFFPKQLVVASARSKFPVHRCKTGGAVAKTEFQELCQFGKLQNVAMDGQIGSLWAVSPTPNKRKTCFSSPLTVTNVSAVFVLRCEVLRWCQDEEICQQRFLEIWYQNLQLDVKI